MKLFVCTIFSMSTKIIPPSKMAADTVQFVHGYGVVFPSFFYKKQVERIPAVTQHLDPA
jgi:hypothetical protein